jgi:hypothetical protein
MSSGTNTCAQRSTVLGYFLADAETLAREQQKVADQTKVAV